MVHVLKGRLLWQGSLLPDRWALAVLHFGQAVERQADVRKIGQHVFPDFGELVPVERSGDRQCDALFSGPGTGVIRGPGT